MLINGDFLYSLKGNTFKTFNPATEEAITEVQEAGNGDIDRAVAAARAAFDHGPWRKTSGRERGMMLLKLADLIDQNVDEISSCFFYQTQHV